MQIMIQETQCKGNPNLTPNVSPRSMVRRIVQCSHPNLKGKRNPTNPKPPLMIPSISTNTKQAQFFFFHFLFYFFLFQFFFSFIVFFKVGRIPHQHSPTKRTSNLKPKWSPQTKTPGSKPKGRTKDVTSLTCSLETRERHHHTRENRSEMNTV